jgi:hypothetical protein
VVPSAKLFFEKGTLFQPKYRDSGSSGGTPGEEGDRLFKAGDLPSAEGIVA